MGAWLTTGSNMTLTLAVSYVGPILGFIMKANGTSKLVKSESSWESSYCVVVTENFSLELV
jgi:hypothetical protein